jgi:hypothetical protein
MMGMGGLFLINARACAEGKPILTKEFFSTPAGKSFAICAALSKAFSDLNSAHFDFFMVHRQILPAATCLIWIIPVTIFIKEKIHDKHEK